jgi:LL-diaminopimelate aminotransferase
LPLKKIIIESSDIVGQLPAPIGSEFDGIKKRLAQRSIEVIDLGKIAPPVPEVVARLAGDIDVLRPIDSATGKSIGSRLREKIAEWMQSRFDVKLDPDKEVLLTTGNTPGVYYVFQAFINKGDRVFLPDPAFSLYRSSAYSAGAEIETYELSARTDFLPNLDMIGGAGRKLCKAILINYPHNPTSAVADEAFYGRLVRFAKKNNILIISDAVYNTHTWQRHIHPSLVALPGARYTGIELFTFSFIFNVPMLKLGFAVGCKEFISPLRKIMETFNSRPSGYDLQVADRLMDHCDNITDSVSEFLGYNRRRFETAIGPLGWEMQPSHATSFAWIRLPRRRLSLNFCRMLLKRTGVVTLPGIAFGEKGEGYMRISLAAESKQIDKAAGRIMDHSKFYQRRYRRKQEQQDE